MCVPQCQKQDWISINTSNSSANDFKSLIVTCNPSFWLQNLAVISSNRTSRLSSSCQRSSILTRPFIPQDVIPFTAPTSRRHFHNNIQLFFPTDSSFQDLQDSASKMNQQLNQAKNIWRKANAVCFDVDSTVIQEEAIDELAKFCGKGEEVQAL